MNWVQLGKIGQDYGAIILLVVLVLAGIWLLWKAFPVVSSIVEVVNLLKKLPAWMTKVDASNDRNEATLGEIKGSIDETSVALKRHVEASGTNVVKLDTHLIQSESSFAEWSTIKTGFWDMRAKMDMLLSTMNKIDVTQDTVAHEVKHNGGSSIKDSTVRTEDRLKRIENLLNEKLGGDPS